MLKNFEHVGIIVGDLDRSIAFYRDLLGLKLILRKSAPKGSGEVAFLDAGGGQLELVAPGGEISPATDAPANEAGMRHLTFTYEDIDVVFDQLVAAGVPVAEKPRNALNPEILVRVAFVRDPDNIMIELGQR